MFNIVIKCKECKHVMDKFDIHSYNEKGMIVKCPKCDHETIFPNNGGLNVNRKRIEISTTKN